jgi:hypothetical protein
LGLNLNALCVSMQVALLEFPYTYAWFLHVKMLVVLQMPKLKGKLNWRKHGNTQRSSEQL